MFTGIVEKVGTVVAVRSAAGGMVRLEIELGELVADLAPGASVAVNGACLTLVERQGSVGGFDVVPETWRSTNLRHARPGWPVNLERSLRVGQRLDGHFVQGHVDGLGTVERVLRQDGQYLLWTRAPGELMPFIVRKGAVALDGVSLTIVDVDAERFSVALIPATLERTVLRRRQPGDQVNIETDILARLVVGWLGRAQGAADSPAGLTWQRLRESGFVP